MQDNELQPEKFCELVYVPAAASPLIYRVLWSPKITVADVLATSGLQASYPELMQMPVGVFSCRVTLDTLVKPGDRIEVYRPLTADPKDKRRQRAKK